MQCGANDSVRAQALDVLACKSPSDLDMIGADDVALGPVPPRVWARTPGYGSLLQAFLEVDWCV